MRIIVLGADGFLGWPTAMHFAAMGHEVVAVDNYAKRKWELEVNVAPLFPVASLEDRAERFDEITARRIEVVVGDVTSPDFLARLLHDYAPDAVIHYAEQPSAPFSMLNVERAIETQRNNVEGTLRLAFAVRDHSPRTHIVKLGTMGEYGTPNIAIEEGWLDVEHKGRRDRVPFPKRPGSMYHASKVHDSVNLELACRIWGLSVTDLNQGVVYGMDTDETTLAPALATSFHYDDHFGTVLNRFIVAAANGLPLPVYGTGTQTRSFLNIRDTLQCVELAVLNPPAKGEFLVRNQFTEVFSVAELAHEVQCAAMTLGHAVRVEYLDNPRVEAPEHYYEPTNDSFLELGFEPRLLGEATLCAMLEKVWGEPTKLEQMAPRARWRG